MNQLMKRVEQRRRIEEDLRSQGAGKLARQISEGSYPAASDEKLVALLGLLSLLDDEPDFPQAA